MDILERIDALRRERGWSVNNLAMEAMLTQSTLNNLYTRRNEPKLSTLRAICGAFGISLSEFFSEERQEETPEKELAHEISLLTDLQKKAILSMIVAFRR